MKKLEDKRQLKEVITTFDQYFFEQDFKELALFFSDTKRYFSENLSYKYLEDKVNKYDSFQIEHDYRYEPYDDDRYSEFILYGERLETDEELNKRLEDSKKAKLLAKKAQKIEQDKKKKKEFALFKRLNKIYGSK